MPKLKAGARVKTTCDYVLYDKPQTPCEPTSETLVPYGTTGHVVHRVGDTCVIRTDGGGVMSVRARDLTRL